MVTNKTALKALLANAKSENPQTSLFDGVASEALSDFDQRTVDLMQSAFNGGFEALSAAFALHGAALPGWHFDIATEASGKGFYCSLSARAWGGALIAVSDTPARAWLIAILKALIAEGEGQ